MKGNSTHARLREPQIHRAMRSSRLIEEEEETPRNNLKSPTSNLKAIPKTHQIFFTQSKQHFTHKRIFLIFASISQQWPCRNQSTQYNDFKSLETPNYYFSNKVQPRNFMSEQLHNVRVETLLTMKLEILTKFSRKESSNDEFFSRENKSQANNST